MSDLIDALLNLSKNSVKSIQIKTVNISNICQDIVKRIGEDDADRKVSVHIQPDIIVNADAMSMTILLENLIGNAWKYTRHRKKACISFGMLNLNGNDHPIYFVKDNGIGFEKKFAKHLFSPFQRLYNSEGFEGTGIGLATAHRIITRHRGKIWAESAPDDGTTFYFTINDSGILSNIGDEEILA